MADKVATRTTIMRLKVDLQCDKCYKKVKKVLCKFPQIRDQVFDEKNNLVTIKVVCCDPEKIRDKLCCKACGVIKTIEILEPPKPEKPKEKPKEMPPPPPQKPKEMPPPPPQKPKEMPDPKPPKEPEEKGQQEKPKQNPPPPPPEVKPEPPPPTPVCPPPAAVPIGVCCVPCYEGRPGGPCFHGYGGGPPPCYNHDGYSRPIYDSYGGGGRPCYVSRCDEYFCEDNTSAACIIM